MCVCVCVCVCVCENIYNYLFITRSTKAYYLYIYPTVGVIWCVLCHHYYLCHTLFRKQLSQPSNHSENSTHGQITQSYINNSSDVEIQNQQPINTQNIDSNGYEDVNIRNIHLTERQIENMVTEKTPQYERLQGQVSQCVCGGSY